MLVPDRATRTGPLQPAIVRRAVAAAFRKLDPRVQVRNPVMFVVVVGGVLVTLRFGVDLAAGGGPGGRSFTGQVALWLWLTVLFASFAEVMAEGHGKASVDRLRRIRRDTTRRHKTPDEIALSVLLGALTVVSLVAVAALQPFAVRSGRPAEMVTLVALLVCLIPTTIGALLSPIGIAAMGRLVRHNVVPSSVRAVEAAGRVDTLLLDKAAQLDGVVEGIARDDGTPLVADRLRRMGIRTVLVTGDDPLTAAAVASEAGVDDFLAQATPERKLELVRAEQAAGRRVAVTGNGANDAAALARADVGVAMDGGTVAAKEAGNMVDLDSNPTKLIEIVELGRRLLITRASLTAFSIASGVAECLAIAPALSGPSYPALGRLDVLRLASPQSAVLSAVIFNALIIVAVLPLALRGVRLRPAPATAQLRRNLGVYGLAGLVLPFAGIELVHLAVNLLHLA
jgi:high-affinity K+ transport system ATPase subunit B